MITRIFTILMLFSTSVWSFDGISVNNWQVNPNDYSNQLYHSQVVSEVYSQTGNDLIWKNDADIDQLMMQLHLIDLANVSPEISNRYRELNKVLNGYRHDEFDVMATDAFIAFINYVDSLPEHGTTWLFSHTSAHVKLDPNEASLANFVRAIQTQKLNELLISYQSPLQNDASFIPSFSKLVYHVESEPELYSQKGRVKRKGAAISESMKSVLLHRMSVAGVDVSTVDVSSADASTADASTIEKTGVIYDQALVNVVKKFQKLHGLHDDGVIGPNTIKWLNMSSQARLAALALNSERSRLWPQERDLVVMVNVPEFEMKLWYQGKPLFESRVVVGRKERKTPIMTGNLNQVILNPTWNVPHKIMVKDILPKLKHDQEYLSKNNFDILESWSSQEVVSPELIDWANLKPKSFPYKLRQQPGYGNALGRYKFLIPNRRAIFLHDTPSKGLFGREERAFSSGCVRVEDAGQFASSLLRTQGYSEREIKRRLAYKTKEDNTSIRLRKRVPVHIIYQNVWLEGGQVHYRDDIYNYAANFSHNG